MRIKKANTAAPASPVKATEEISLAPECKYQTAIDLIKGAIDNLSVDAHEDALAKESIANLSVVLLDLKGGC